MTLILNLLWITWIIRKTSGKIIIKLLYIKCNNLMMKVELMNQVPVTGNTQIALKAQMKKSLKHLTTLQRTWRQTLVKLMKLEVKNLKVFKDKELIDDQWRLTNLSKSPVLCSCLIKKTLIKDKSKLARKKFSSKIIRESKWIQLKLKNKVKLFQLT